MIGRFWVDDKIPYRLHDSALGDDPINFVDIYVVRNPINIKEILFEDKSPIDVIWQFPFHYKLTIYKENSIWDYYYGREAPTVLLISPKKRIEGIGKIIFKRGEGKI